MPPRFYILTIVLLICVGAAPAQNAEIIPTLQVSYRFDSVTSFSVPISALFVGDDTVYSGCGAGLYLRSEENHSWGKLMDAAPESSDWMVDCYKKEQLDRVFWPGPLWIAPNTNEVLVYDRHCGLLLNLQRQSSAAVYAQTWRNSWEQSYFWGPALQGDLLLTNGSSEEGSTIEIRKVSDLEFFRRVYTVRGSIRPKLDSVGVYFPNCRPAFNPGDSTIWVEIYGYQFIYILSFRGQLIDSVAIKTADWIPPSQPLSRIKSVAVGGEWRSRWTPTWFFNYAPPGYFILQYRVGWQPLLNDSIPLYGTAVWNTDRQPVDLEIDPRWQLAGVQPDGRIIFGHYECEADSCRVVLEIARIEP